MPQEATKVASAASRTHRLCSSDGLVVSLISLTPVLLLFGLVLGFLATSATAYELLRMPGWAFFAAIGYALFCWLGARQIKFHCDRVSDVVFISALAGLCVVSRLAVATAFPKFVLIGDDLYLRRFVLAVVHGGLTRANLGTLSASYDYPVWLSRSLPLYYWLEKLFSSAGLSALHIANALLDAVTVAATFAIARQLVGSTSARVASWFVAIMPYRIFDVLSYTPQIPGTALFLLGILLLMRTLKSNVITRAQAVTWGVALGFLLVLMRMQRGGIDSLLLALAVVSIPAYAPSRRTLQLAFGTLLIAALVSLPTSKSFERWVESNDQYHLRSHSLGFLSRGWNPVTLGEYFLRYELLDKASSPQEKRRVLFATLATEIVREPVVTLIVVPVAKATKFFAIGYSSVTETGLAAGGYESAAAWAKAMRLGYAPILLLFCVVGAMAAIRHETVARRLALPIFTTLLAAGAIVSIWEASPRYSHCIHFALVTIAAVGFTEFSDTIRGVTSIERKMIGRRAVATVVVAALAWIVIAVSAYFVARGASSYTFANLGQATSNINGDQTAAIAITPRTASWERAIAIPAETKLPAKIQLGWPITATAINPANVRLSVWLPDIPTGYWSRCRIVIPSSSGEPDEYEFRGIVPMKRGTWSVQSNDKEAKIEILIQPPNEKVVQMAPQPLSLDVGYVLPD